MRALGVLAGLLAVAGALWLVRPARPGATPRQPLVPVTAPEPAPEPVAVPLTSYEERRGELMERRAALVERLQAVGVGPVSCSWPTELDTLDLIPHAGMEAAVPALVSGVIAPEAYGYGIRRVRWFIRTDPPDAKSLRLVAETTRDTGGAWRTFWK